MIGTFLIILSVCLCCSLESQETLKPFDLLYEEGIQAYYRNDWQGVIYYMEEATRSYTQQRNIKIQCRLQCEKENEFQEAAEPNLIFFAVIMRRAHCIQECESQRMGPASMYRVSEEVAHEFQRRIVYNYLQLAYYKLDELDKAAEAAHTFFLANPEHMEMRESLERYKQMEGVKESHFIDREMRPYMEAFSNGLKHYDEEQYPLAIDSFEEALSQYWLAETECRAFCQGPQQFDANSYPAKSSHIYELIADHYIQVLQCEHDCVRELATRAGRLSPIENYLPMHYDFLQYSYFKVDNYEKALEASKSYLLIRPTDEDMLENQEYYQSVLEGQVDTNKITPRQDLVWFMKRYELEKEILQLVSDELGFLYLDPINWTVSAAKAEDENNSVRRFLGQEESAKQLEMMMSQNQMTEKKGEQDLQEGGPLLYDRVKLVRDSQQLNGSQRVLLDDVITAQECGELYQLASSIAMAGDGYRGKMSPHTPNERFEGATVYKALMYGYEGRIPLHRARLFYDVSEKARKIIQSYFMLNSTLYFSYTHLVCRTAIEGQQDNRNDLSHPIHADNCLLDPDANECWKEPPAYTYRDYSAILYLNGDFEGGEFIFTEIDAKTITAAVKPQCGRMVGFSSGEENPHGVKAVTKGQRCAVALWFTLDPLFRELERIKADEVVELISLDQRLDDRLTINPRDEL
ncbi:prolyl 3-hydroxylase 2 [Carcharodon carcharias]|uniref:prolyl 3-hydroxylase 2 n=1 Tax=Carcharodon carcharias TaxID=13397 RepID=UPI001B7DD426|nr:prolyl 3-hydroxylase 2 [Carcharodon carcharias]